MVLGNHGEQDLGAKQGRSKHHRDTVPNQHLWSWSQQASSPLGTWPWFGLWGSTVAPWLPGWVEGMELLYQNPPFLPPGRERHRGCLCLCQAGCSLPCMAPAPSRIPLRHPDGSAAGCCDPDHVPSPTVRALARNSAAAGHRGSCHPALALADGGYLTARGYEGQSPNSGRSETRHGLAAVPPAWEARACHKKPGKEQREGDGGWAGTRGAPGPLQALRESHG